MLEYALLLSFAAAMSVALTSTFNNITKRGITKFNAVLESELRTGQYDNPSAVGIWEN